MPVMNKFGQEIPDISLLTRPQLDTVLALRAINAAGKQAMPQGQAASPAANDIAQMIAKANTLKADASAIDGGGLPGYFDPQARTSVGMSPGPIQHGFSPEAAQSLGLDPRVAMLSALQGAPQPGNAGMLADRAVSLPSNVDLGANLRGSLQNNMRDRFSRLAMIDQAMQGGSPSAPAEPRGNPNLTPAEFLRTFQPAMDSADQAVMAGLPDSHQRVAQINPGKAQFATYLERRAKAEGKLPQQVLDDNAAAAGDRRQAALASQLGIVQGSRQAMQGGGLGNLGGMMINPVLAGRFGGPEAFQAALHHNATMAQLAASQQQHSDQLGLSREQMMNDLQAKLAALAETKAGREQQGQISQGGQQISMMELMAKLQQMQHDQEMQRIAASPDAAAERTIAQEHPIEYRASKANPAALSNLADPVMHDVAQGKLSDPVFERLKELHDGSNIYRSWLGSGWMPEGLARAMTSHGTHLANVKEHFSQAFPDVPRPVLDKLTEQFYLRHYGTLPQ